MGTLMKKIYLIDCPGIVPPGKGETDTEKVLRGVVRVEHLQSPEDYVAEILNRCKHKYIARHYKISTWSNHIDFLEQLAKKCGRLGKGGEPDLNAVSKIILNDWNRGKLPFFVPPPGCSFEPKPDIIEDELVSESEAEEYESENEEVEDDTNVEDSINEAVVEPEDTLQQTVPFPE